MIAAEQLLGKPRFNIPNLFCWNLDSLFQDIFGVSVRAIRRQMSEYGQCLHVLFRYIYKLQKYSYNPYLWKSAKKGPPTESGHSCTTE